MNKCCNLFSILFLFIFDCIEIIIGQSPSSKDIWGEVCGDGIVIHDTVVNWDDRNFIDGDGWSSTWTVERGWVWSGGTPVSIDIWKTQCGDGIIAPLIEEWDYKNLANGDGWSSSCSIEEGYICRNDYSALINSVWYEIWGDGKKYGINLWDDGNKKMVMAEAQHELLSLGLHAQVEHQRKETLELRFEVMVNIMAEMNVMMEI